MPLRHRALVAALALLLSGAAPVAAACLERAGEPMGCCSRGPCEPTAVQRACCPCSPQAATTPPSDSAVKLDGLLVVGPAPWGATAGLWPGPISSAVGAAFRTARLKALHDPPWLLHSVLLI